MGEVSLSEAASRLGVSVDTVRRRLRSGQLAGRQSGRRLFVTLPEIPSDEPVPAEPADLLAEVRAERDRLAALVGSLMQQLESESAERKHLLTLLERSLGGREASSRPGRPSAAARRPGPGSS
jgi:excisionase family DNA binding protein